MGTYLQHYGAGEERRNRTIKIIILSAIAILVAVWILYLAFQNYSEKRVVRHFLDQLNGHQYEQAYSTWGCTAAAPCTNYDYKRFLQDWGPDKKITSPWKINSVDGCKAFVTVNVEAGGSGLQSLGVERGSKSLTFAPAPECQEPKWHWRQFFQRLFGRSQS